jgi:uncharacterized protein (DUF1330 family)
MRPGARVPGAHEIDQQWLIITVAAMEISLCVLLWARPGAAAALSAYEDKVLALLDEHGGRLVQRARTTTTDDAPTGAPPTEVQLIGFSSRAGYDGYMADERRLALAHERDAAIERTTIHPVQLL